MEIFLRFLVGALAVTFIILIALLIVLHPVVIVLILYIGLFLVFSYFIGEPLLELLKGLRTWMKKK
jgi:hypothetical protein